MHHPLKEYNQVEKGQTVTGASNREIYQHPIALFIQNTFNYLLNTIVCCLKTPKDAYNWLLTNTRHCRGMTRAMGTRGLTH
jgi:hypothetical protein